MTTQTLTNAAAIDTAKRPSIWARIDRMFAVYRQRQQLSKLDDAALRDIGVTPVQRQLEVVRPVWDVPS